jgi:hypothetical protein
MITALFGHEGSYTYRIVEWHKGLDARPEGAIIFLVQCAARSVPLSIRYCTMAASPMLAATMTGVISRTRGRQENCAARMVAAWFLGVGHGLGHVHSGNERHTIAKLLQRLRDE